MSDIAEQIDALLALNAKGAVSHPGPGLAVELLQKAAQSLRASIPGGVGVKGDEIEELIEQLLDAQQDINLAANERMDQSLCDASALIDKTETMLRRILSALDLLPAEGSATHQARVAGWMLECFGPEITADKVERADRFIEEALELAQATGWTADRGHALVDYVFSRPVGVIGQEVGGVMVTLAALCNVFEIDIEAEAKREVDRITQPDIVLKIRAKQAAKPTGSALPVAAPSNPVISDEMIERAVDAYKEAYINGHVSDLSECLRAALTAALSVKPQSGENE